MAVSIITMSGIRRRTKTMSLHRAISFAKALEANPRLKLREILVGKETNGAYVEFVPEDPRSIARLVKEEKRRRELKARTKLAAYRWRKVGKCAYECVTPRGNQYTQFLDVPKCTCPDFPRISGIGGICKHLIYAQMLEDRKRGVSWKS